MRYQLKAPYRDGTFMQVIIEPLEFMAHIPVRHPSGDLRSCRLVFLPICHRRAGGHGAALNEGNWEPIARFVLPGPKVEPPPALASTRQSLAVKLAGRVAPLLWAGILTCVIKAYPALWNLSLAKRQRLLLVAGSGWAISPIMTAF